MLKNKDNDLLSNNIDNSLDYKLNIKPYYNKSFDFDNNYTTFSSGLSAKQHVKINIYNQLMLLLNI